MLVVRYGIFHKRRREIMALIPQYDVGRPMIQSRLLWMQSGLLWAKICRRVPGALRHYNQIGLSVLVASGLVALGAAHTSADTIYSYTGNPFTFAASPYTTNDFISGSFDLATPLDNNLPLTAITPTSFSFFDGVRTFHSATPGVFSSFNIQTDATGTPDHWNIFISIPPSFTALTTANLAPPQITDTITFPPITGPRAGNLNNPGTWSVVPGPIVGAGLPGFLAACVGLLAWWRRRRKIA
jgi:hypothetical protein